MKYQHSLNTLKPECLVKIIDWFTSRSAVACN